MIPQEKSAAVTRGLREAFGVTECEDIRELAGGLGANPVFRIVVRGSAFLLRINLRAGDLTRHYACMTAAADAGLAPRVWYTSVEDRVSITDFVETTPFPQSDALRRIPAVLRSLHALPPFPPVPNHLNTTFMFLINQGPAVDAFLQKFQAANILPKDETAELLARYEQLSAVYTRFEPDRVSSHNDLFKPDNMLFDGRRLWLVDWEAAFHNDRYADLAVVANLVVTNDAEERLFLQEYLGEPPEPYPLARLFVARQAAHLFYAVVYLFLASSSKPIDWSEPVPDFVDFQRRLWSREVNLTDTPAKTVFGRVHWKQFSQNVRQARFDEALRIVSGSQAPS